MLQMHSYPLFHTRLFGLQFFSETSPASRPHSFENGHEQECVMQKDTFVEMMMMGMSRYALYQPHDPMREVADIVT